MKVQVQKYKYRYNGMDIASTNVHCHNANIFKMHGASHDSKYLAAGTVTLDLLLSDSIWGSGFPIMVS